MLMPPWAKLPQHVFAGIIHRRTLFCLPYIPSLRHNIIFCLPVIVRSPLWYFYCLPGNVINSRRSIICLPLIILLRQLDIFRLPNIPKILLKRLSDTDRQLRCTTGIRTPFSKGCKPFIQGFQALAPEKVRLADNDGLTPRDDSEGVFPEKVPFREIFL